MTRNNPSDLLELLRQVQETIDRDEVVEIKRLPNGTEIVVLTASGSLYEMVVVDSESGSLKISGGIFQKTTDIKLVGATFGSSSSVWLGRIGHGYNLELFALDTKEIIRTSPVKHITVNGVRSVGTVVRA